MASKLPHSFLKEQYDKQNRMIKVSDEFLPDRRGQGITSKFYSRHDQQTQYDPGQRKSIKFLEQCRDKVPQEKYPSPVLESHVYGWNIGAPEISQYDPVDRRILHKPRRFHEMTKIGAQILKENFIYRSGPFGKTNF